MTQVLQQLDDTRDALLDALSERNWGAIAKLDEDCRACIDRMLSEGVVSEEIAREKLEGLLQLYRELIDVSTGERQSIAEEMMQIKQARNASKVYHLFS
ncbi:hypothetical protein [Pseudomonas putida]|uniref:hypothetical protein n=1 Tax=Pseudomonas putida TaxID=303 RepID=UPI00030456D6|nr:hypothetical protein [Pseudomonas putida]